MVCLSEGRYTWRMVNRQSLTGLDWLNDDIGILRQAYETACRVMPDGATWQAIATGDTFETEIGPGQVEGAALPGLCEGDRLIIGVYATHPHGHPGG